MPKKLLFLTALFAVASLMVISTTATAQQTRSYGSLSGTVTDPEGLPVPGVTVRAESESAMGQNMAVTGQQGRYRLLNLPPGTYTVVAELVGFAPVRREGVIMRAGADYRVDLQLSIGGVEETITVTAETPMLDIAKPGQVFNIEGDFQRNVPVQSRKNWSDFLELTPGINARPFDDGSGRMVYFGHGAEHFSHVVQLEGNMAQGYRDAQITYTQMSTDMIEDIQIRSGGVEASAPIGTGLVINIVTKSGGNRFSGSAGYTLQPLDWNGDNAGGKANPSTPTIQKINQVDFAVGGPIVQDKAWFFFSGRYAKNEAGISRTGREAQLLQDYWGAFGGETFNNSYSGFFPYLKISAQPKPGQSFTGYYQYDRNKYRNEREYHVGPQPENKTGGSVFGAKLTSLWGDNITSDILVTYNDKTSSFTSLEDIKKNKAGPYWELHGDTYLSGRYIYGTGLLLAADTIGSATIGPSKMFIIRADTTYYLEGAGGSHEFQTGIFAAPILQRRSQSNYLNDGFITEYRVTSIPGDTSSPAIPYYRDVRNPTQVDTNRQKDRDIGVYFQDAWKPNDRLSITAGIRADFIRRYDDLGGIERMNAVAVGPRLGVSYMLTSDARNVIRGSIGRIHEQVNGRDSASSGSSPYTYERYRYYDTNLDGNFETVRYTPPATSRVAQAEYSDDITQPYADEYILGFRRQFPGEVALDVGYIHRDGKNRYGWVDVNGYYPDGPYQPFQGFGRIDPDLPEIWQMRNADWNKTIYDAIEVTVAKRMRDNWQFMGSLNKQWQKMGGTWNPTDPAKFIQPDHFDISRCIEQPRSDDGDSLSGGTYCPTWREYSIRLGGTYNAPYGIVLTGTYTIQDGPWSGTILTQLDSDDPDIAQFGPGTVTSVTGNRESNPLSTRTRFKYPTRDEGQQKLADVKTLSIKIGKEFNLYDTHRFEVSLNIFNVFNNNDFNQYTYNGANEEWNPSFLEGRSMQAARAFQLNFNYRF
jgi:hypothetical protein